MTLSKKKVTTTKQNEQRLKNDIEVKMPKALASRTTGIGTGKADTEQFNGLYEQRPPAVKGNKI